MASNAPVIVWFRQDLRLADNPALTAAAATGRPVLPIYILDDASAGDMALGAASRWWLHHSLCRLNASLHGKLLAMSGNVRQIIMELVDEAGAAAVFWNRCYEPWRIPRDRQIKAALRETGRTATSFDGTVLYPPQSVSKADGTPYRVFTPYYRKGCLEAMPSPRTPLPTPTFEIATTSERLPDIESLQLLPRIRWYAGIEAIWTPGESGAHERLAEFLKTGIHKYKEGRNRPDQPFVSRLSPHLHFGEISPNQAWYAAATSGAPQEDIDHFRSELGWREFSRYLLYHFPDLTWQNFQPKFDRFPWRSDAVTLDRWQKGKTGIPIVDAGMRELWQTGYMHNRVRMIVASFLVKNLLIDWRHGENWFRDTLVDADLANNSASWQWVAGSGADAAPYFRIFNPVTQGKKFDPDGSYVRNYVPELSQLPAKMIHDPWEWTENELLEFGVTLGGNYPSPMVSLRESRQAALDAFKALGSDRSR